MVKEHLNACADCNAIYQKLLSHTSEDVLILKNVNAAKKALVVTAENNENVIKSAKNIEGVATATVNTINVYDILKYDSFIITTDAVKKVEEVYA